MRILLVATALAMTAGCAGYLPPPPPGPAVQTVANSNWRVVAVNGRATPVRGEFYVRFGTNTFGAKFGCNGIGGEYVQRGYIIDTERTAGTLMACPDMSYENQGAAIVSLDMRANWSGPRALRLTNRAGTIDLKR